MTGAQIQQLRCQAAQMLSVVLLRLHLRVLSDVALQDQQQLQPQMIQPLDKQLRLGMGDWLE